MITFDSFTLIPQYSDINSRNEVDLSTTICNTKIDLPIINANMLSICTPEMVNILSNKANTFSSYHRFFNSIETKKATILNVSKINKDKFWMSIGTKEEEYDFVDWLYDHDIKNVILDVNHGHHKTVGNMINFIIKNYPSMKIMAGNVSSTAGIKYLKDCGAHLIKCGNSGGSACTTAFSTGFYGHCLHVIKSYREDTGDWETKLCGDGGFKSVSDIAKCLIWGDLVMLGGMLAGSDESYGTKIYVNGSFKKEYYGNASAKTKMVSNDENHIKFVEGTTKLVDYTGPLTKTLDGISDGLKSALSFVNARNLSQYKANVLNSNSILMI